MKKISLILIALLTQSCGHWSSSTFRSPATSETPDGPIEMIASLDCQSEHRAHSTYEVHYRFQGKLLSFLDHQMLVTDLHDCSTEKYSIKETDRFMTVVPSVDHLYLHTLHGKVLSYDQDQLQTLAIPFPVNAFEIDQDKMSIYSANDQGRFCSFAELKKQKNHRDFSCLSVALILPL